MTPLPLAPFFLTIAVLLSSGGILGVLLVRAGEWLR